MKKIIVILLTATVLLSFATVPAFSEEGLAFAETTTSVDYSQFEGVTLNVFNWGYFISDGTDDTVNVNEEFEKLTGIKVVYDTYDSNEKMYAKLSAGGANYDVVIPSDYMIGRLIEEDYLAELDFSNIPNYKYISESYKNTQYDPDNKYSVPYSVGMVGIIYNTKQVEGTPDSWSLMWDEKYSGKILNFDNSRDAFATAQFYQGLDINSENTADWDKAYDKLLEQKDVLQGYVMDTVFNKMESGEAAVAPYYAGDFFTMYGNNPDLAFYYPKEGTNVFIDAACVLKTSQNKKAAELYINFLLDPEIARANAEYIYYASPNTAVINNEDYKAYLAELHPDAYDILYGTIEGYNADSFVNLSDSTKQYMNDLWEKVKSAKTETGYGLYIVCGVILAVIVGYLVFAAVRKKKREQE